MRIGVFGGSFNPVHNGHLRLASYALSELNLNRVIFVPSNQTPLKKKEVLLPAALRLSLLKAAVKKNRSFGVSDCELKRGGMSFTVDTLKAFKKKWGKKTELYFLSGADVVQSLDRWKSPKKVFQLCRFVVVTRPGFKGFRSRWPVLWMPMEPVPVSSSMVRGRLSKGQSVRGLVPPLTLPALRRYFKKIKKEI